MDAVEELTVQNEDSLFHALHIERGRILVLTIVNRVLEQVRELALCSQKVWLDKLRHYIIFLQIILQRRAC